MNQEDQEVIDLFWTGGWDSTFRLLQILLIENKKVRPHYMIWGGESIGKAIETMQSIRSKLFSDYPDTQKRLLPIEYFDGLALKANDDITNAHKIVGENNFVSIQYEKLARYCNQSTYNNIEIGIEKDSRSQELIDDYLIEYKPSKYKLDREKSPQPFFDLFKFFSFPLLDYNKLDMESVAKQKGWAHLMYMTWFCRRPRNGRPCGFCGPCTDTLIDGLSKRLPFRARIIAYMQLPFRKWWRDNYEKRSTGIYKYIKELLKHKA